MRKHIYVTHGSILHAIGNLILSIIGLLDNILCIVTFGFVYTDFQFIWTMKRMNTIFYQERDED